MKGTLGLLLPGILMAAMFSLSLSWLTAPLHSASTRTKKEAEQSPLKKEWTSLFVLIGVVIMRSWIQLGLVTYIPFYYIDYLKGGPLYAGKLVSTFMMAGVVGTLVGAPLADRWGHKKFLSISMLLTVPLLLLFYKSSGFMVFVILGIAGIILFSSQTVTMVMAQALLPRHLGMASGLMVGLAVGTGGMGVTLLGAIADHWGVPMAIRLILLLPCIGYGLSLLVKYPPHKAE
jgi:FSR family fosmidomycin resistance protein-like MFS transporter